MSHPRLPEVFAEAIGLDQAGRRRLLTQIAARDDYLAAELKRLLSAADHEGVSVVDRSPWQALAGVAAPPIDAPLPASVGPYRIVRELGRGGMGRVFLAEQKGEDFERRVALKVVTQSNASAEAERRFRAEQRILASLEHPGIARFYDAGRTDDGNWFLALEYVEGEDLISFSRRRGLDVRARVELFLEVVEAVDFAHRRLIVHRDVKPGNVLVSEDGHAKLLDFGISRILDDETGAGTTTLTEHRAYTPAYASPEQLRGEPGAVATDIYSLGVVLYQLLAGQRPFAHRSAGEADREPPPPSTAVRSAAVEGDGSETTDTRPSWRELSGDLDAIILKALRAEPESRYLTAAAFADDLRRWLEQRPVAARRGGRRYRLAKFARRHRPSLAAAAGVVLALFAGMSVALVQRSRALEAQARAEATLADVHGLTQSMLFDINDQVLRLPGSLPVSGTIVRSATAVLDQLTASSCEDRRLLTDLATGYEKLGTLFLARRAFGRSLDQPQTALTYLERALAIREGLAKRKDAPFDDRLAAARSYDGVAQAQYNAGDRAGSARTSAEGLRRLYALDTDAPDPPYLRYWIAVAHTRAARRPVMSRRHFECHPEVLAHHRVAVALWRELVAEPPAAMLADPYFTRQGGFLASRALQDADYLEEALRASELVLEALDSTPARAPDLPQPAGSSALGPNFLANGERQAILEQEVDLLEDLGRLPEALEGYKRLLSFPLSQDSEAVLLQSIVRLTDISHAARLGVRLGELEFAAGAIGDAERRMTAAEQRFGTASFLPLRAELEYTRSLLLLGRADSVSMRSEQHRLLSSALTACRHALHLAESVGTDHAHGLDLATVDALHALERDLDEKLRQVA